MRASLDTRADDDRRERIEEALEAARPWLPHQGPIGVFIHQNTLQVLQHREFHEALLEGAELYGARPYLEEAEYRRLHARGRIGAADLAAALRAADAPPRGEPAPRADSVLRGAEHATAAEGSRGARLAAVGARLGVGDLRERAMLHDLDVLRDHAEALAFHERALPASLVDACRARLERAPLRETGAGPRPRTSARHRDACLSRELGDPDRLVHSPLIAACSAFCDEGVAPWTFPDRASGLYVALRTAWSQRPPRAFSGRLAAELRAQADAKVDALGAIERVLRGLGVPSQHHAEFIRAVLLALPGWAGMISWLEHHGHDERRSARLADLLALRLTLDWVALAKLLRSPLNDRARFAELYERARAGAPPRVQASPRARALQLARVARACGWSARRVEQLGAEDVRDLLSGIDAFGPLPRRRIWQEAYEHHYRAEVLTALSLRRALPSVTPQQPQAQVVFCIDEREESLRRHLEEVHPEVETIGTAGFFGLAMSYRGLDDGHFAPLCPVVVDPQHAIEERAHPDDEHALARRRRRQRQLTRSVRALRRSSNSLVRGWVLSAGLGGLAALAMLLRLGAPRHATRLAGTAARIGLPRPRSALTRTHEGQHSPHGKPLGFALAEQVERVGALVVSAGFAQRLAPLVIVLGHGSTSLNNPHESAHDCGACGGRRGGPNARLFAEMANDPEVRAGVAERFGVRIDAGTWFVGGLHDTCSDAVVLYDLERVPAEHAARLRTLRTALDDARARSAHERCRRFVSAPLRISPASALREVERRACALDEPRPEYGHATNALCIVGRRERTRGIFLDRRAFLVSYDPDGDSQGAILEGTLGAVVPVCAGISLEYYFSSVDNERYGCGTKTPHNVTGLVGIMNGHRGDLRTGLPWQMVEIHEPMRLLMVVEAPPQRILEIALRRPQIGEFVFNGWIRMASLDPASGQLLVLEGRKWLPFEGPVRDLPSARSSASWYEGRREPLSPALVGPVADAAQAQGRLSRGA